MDLSPSRVIVRGAVIFPRKLAEAVGSLGTAMGCQFPAVDQLPLASRFHCGGGSGPAVKLRNRLLPTWLSANVPAAMGLVNCEESSVNLLVSKPVMPPVALAINQE